MTEDLFEGYQVVCVVDDWKGAWEGRATSPVSYFGRCYTAASRETVAELDEALGEACADKWHQAGPSLHQCAGPQRERIITLAKAGSAFALTTLFSEQDLRRLDLVEGYRDQPAMVLDMFPAKPHAMAFANYLSCLIVECKKRGYERIRVISDYMNWLEGGKAKIEQRLRYRGKGHEGACLDMEFKSRRTPLTLLRFLGLADSETWAHGRMQMIKLPDGRTMRDVMLDFQAKRGPMPTEEVIMAAMADADASHREYWKCLAGWIDSGHLLVNPWTTWCD